MTRLRTSLASPKQLARSIEKTSSGRSKLSGLTIASPSSKSISKSAITSRSTDLDAVAVKASNGGGEPSTSEHVSRKRRQRLRYEGRKSCPHSDTQCASSTTARLNSVPSFKPRRRSRNSLICRRSGATSTNQYSDIASRVSASDLP